MNLSDEISLLFKVLNKDFCLRKFPIEVDNISFTIFHHGHYDDLHNTSIRLIKNSLPKITKPRLFVEFRLMDSRCTIPGYLTPLFYTTLEDLIKCLGFHELLYLVDLNIELK